jgi:hypothetical protein
MKKSRREKSAISSASARARNRFGNVGCALFSIPVFLAGAATIYFMGLGPVIKVLRASSWETVPCEITSSKVARSNDGDTFAIEVRYKYSFDGGQYEGTRYGFMGGCTTGYSSKDEVIKQNPVGKRVTRLKPEAASA